MSKFQIKKATESLRKREMLGEDSLEGKKEGPLALENEYILPGRGHPGNGRNPQKQRNEDGGGRLGKVEKFHLHWDRSSG